MAVSWLFLLILLIEVIVIVNGSHFRGGIISWRALNTTPSGSTAQVLVHQRYAWRRNSFPVYCNDSTIAAQTLISTGTGSLLCYTGGSCSAFTTVSTDVHCTDYSVNMNFSLGERYDTFTFPLNATFIVGFNSSAWLVLAIKGNGNWQVTNKIQLTTRPDGYINTSPVTSTLPVIYRTINVQHVHVIQMADADSTDTLRCRWSTSNLTATPNNWNECGSVCAPTLPLYTLFPNNCTLVFTITNTSYYAVALQIEDFYTSTSTTPMSSVPIQFLFFGIVAPSGCSTAPSIIGVRPNLACIGTPIGNLTNETVIAQIGCSNKTIVEFTTSSPIGLIKSAITNPSAGIYMITLLFTPTSNQYGPQGFCAAAVDNTGVQSDSWCITFLVGFTAPDLQSPLLVQGTASPVGTVFSNQSIFSIQSKSGAVNRPGHNGTYVYFNDATLNGTVVLSYDCGWSPNVIYSGNTIIVYAPFAWVPAHQYYVTFDSGASSGNDFCHAESAPIMNPNFWRFDIWNPALSSTTTTTTTPPTTHTVTTKPLGTTTPVANLTTTGIVITTVNVTAGVTTTTTSDTTTSSTTESTSTTSALVTDMIVMTPKDFEDACKQTVFLGTLIYMVVVMIPVHMIAMYSLFIKLDQMFNPHRILADQRRKHFINRMNKKK